MTDVELAGDVDLRLAETTIDDRTLERLGTVLDLDLAERDDGTIAIRSATLDLDRLARVMALHRSIARFRYDWRTGSPSPSLEADD